MLCSTLSLAMGCIPLVTLALELAEVVAVRLRSGLAIIRIAVHVHIAVIGREVNVHFADTLDTLAGSRIVDIGSACAVFCGHVDALSLLIHISIRKNNPLRPCIMTTQKCNTIVLS